MPPKGVKHSAATKAKMSASQRGRKISDQDRAKKSAANLGKRHSPETRAKLSAIMRATRGPTARSYVHGYTRTPTYNVWVGLRQRCNNPRNEAYERYGGRGITVCERWQGPKGFPNFLADMGAKPPALTLDRIDNDGNYEPANCRWATPKQQAANRRKAKPRG